MPNCQKAKTIISKSLHKQVTIGELAQPPKFIDVWKNHLPLYTNRRKRENRMTRAVKLQ